MAMSDSGLRVAAIQFQVRLATIDRESQRGSDLFFLSEKRGALREALRSARFLGAPSIPSSTALLARSMLEQYALLCFAFGRIDEGGRGTTKEGMVRIGVDGFFTGWRSAVGVAAFLPLLSFPSGHLDLTTPACCLLLRFLFEPYKSR